MTDQDFTATNPILDPDERDIEAPDIDAYEQALPADPREAAQPPLEVNRDLEVNDWDALEQARIVDLEDEDY
jgi:hypothetical protein